MPNRTCSYTDPHNALACTECSLDISLCMCVDPDAIAHDRLVSVDGLVMRMVRDEIAAARTAYPGTTHLLATVMEKVGLLSTAMARHDSALGTSPQEVLREAVQAAAMVIRVASEGDNNYLYDFPAVEAELPKGPVSDRF